MTYEIYINDSLIEISTPKTIGLTFQVASIFDPESRSGNLTNSFIAPFTLVNNIVLGNLLNINSDSNLPYQRNTAKIVQNGIEIVPDGFALIDEASDGYKITIYSGNVSFFDLIKDLNVNDLDWTDLNHVYSASNIVNSYLGITKYIYPIIEFGKGIDLLNSSNSQEATSFVPTVYVEEIFDRFFNYIGYTHKGTFKNKQEYPRLILTPNNFGLSSEDAIALNGIANNAIQTTYSTFIQNYTASGVYNVTWNVPVVYQTIDNPLFSGLTYTPDTEFIGTLSTYLSFGHTHSPNITTTVNVQVRIYKDASLLYSSMVFVGNGSYQQSTVNLTIPNLLFEIGSVYSVVFRVLEQAHVTSNFTSNIIVSYSAFSVIANVNQPYNTLILFQNLYNKMVGELVKDISNMYNLIIQTNEVTKGVFISPLDDLTANIPNAINWSGKVDLSKKITVKYNIGSYAQKNKLEYSKTDDVIDGYGSDNLLVANTNLPNEKTLLTISTAASESQNIVLNENTPLIPLSESTNVSFNDKKNRILLLEPKDVQFTVTKISVSHSTTITTDVPFCYFSKTGKADSLDFTNLIAANYSTLQGMLNKIKFVAAYFQLKETDVVNIDFTIPIYLDISDGKTVVNGYFYINKISNFKVDSSTLVELIRL